MIKKGISVFVLAIFLAHFAGFYIYFVFQLNQVKQEAQAKLKLLPVDSLELIVLSIEDFKDAKIEESEIEVGNKLYDVVKTRLQGDKVFVYCLRDEAEDDILAFLDKVLCSPLKDRQVPTGILQFLTLNYLLEFWNFPLPSFINEKISTCYKESSSSVHTQKISPPPKGSFA